jgi:hypothetical protein
MDTKVVTPPERTQAVQPTREAAAPAPQTDSAAKLESAGSIYWSPVVRIDNETQTAVFEYLDPKTGAVLRSYPHQVGSQAYAKAQDDRRSKEAKAQQPVAAKPSSALTAPPAATKPTDSATPADSAATGKSVLA